MSIAEDVERIAEPVVARFGGLHIAVNNAGIVNRGLAWELGLPDWKAVLDVNLWGVIHGVRSFVPRILRTGEEGHVVNVASMAAVLPQERLGPYTVAKHGVLGLSDVLRADLKAVNAPVGVCVVMPGRIRTGMNPVGTVEPDAVAANVLDAIVRGREYVFTDDHSSADVRMRLGGDHRRPQRHRRELKHATACDQRDARSSKAPGATGWRTGACLASARTRQPRLDNPARRQVVGT